MLFILDNALSYGTRYKIELSQAYQVNVMYKTYTAIYRTYYLHNDDFDEDNTYWCANGAVNEYKT